MPVDLSDWGLALIHDKKLIDVAFDKYKTAIGRNKEFLSKNVSSVAGYVYSQFLIPYMETEIVCDSVLYNMAEGTSSAGFLFGGNKEDALQKYGDKVMYYLNYPLQYIQDIDTLFVIAAKDEVRLREKEPRSYSYPDMIFNMLLQRYTKYQNISLGACWKQTPFAVGIDVFEDWNWLISNWEKCPGNLYIEWDFSRYDRSICGEIMQEIAFMRIQELDPTEANIVLRLYERLINRKNLMYDGRVIITQNGNPSGQPNTTYDNCFAHMIIWGLCWKDYYGNLSGFKEFIETSGFKIFGDDGAACIEENFRPFIEAIQGGLITKITGSTIEFQVHTKLENLTFLGRKPFRLNGVWVSRPANVDKLMQSLKMKARKKHSLTNQFARYVAYYKQFYYCKFLAKDTDENRCFQTLDSLIKSFISDYGKFLSMDADYVANVRQYKVEIPMYCRHVMIRR